MGLENIDLSGLDCGGIQHGLGFSLKSEPVKLGNVARLV